MIGTVMMAGALLVSGTQSQLVATGGQFATSARWANPSAVTYDPAKVPVGSRVLVVERAVHGELSVDQAVRQLDARADQILEKRRWLLARRSAP